MLSISNPRNGSHAADYYSEIAEDDYYANRHENPGIWRGNGATILGLDGYVTTAALKNLIRGFSPGGDRTLVQNADKEDRQGFWDLTFSAPKSVSVLWAVASPGIRKEIEAAHDAAVSAGVAFVEENAGLTRRGKGGAKLEKAKLVFASFDHATSRALDPQIHTHALLLNIALREDGSTGAILSKSVFKLRVASGTLYAAVLALELSPTSAIRLRKGRFSRDFVL